MNVLDVTGLTTGFGGNQVLHGVDLALPAGRTAVLLGLNGAGKSVTLKTISGLQPAWAGQVRLRDRDVTRLEPEDRVRAGLGHVLQARAVFPHLSVAENLRLGGAVVRNRARHRAALERVLTIYPRLAERLRQAAGSLSGGEQAMLAVGRALMSEPTVLLVDEPSAGLAPIMVERLRETLTQVQAAGTAMLVVEQHVGFGIELADDAYVLEKGRVVYHDQTSTLDREKVAALLGIGELLEEPRKPGKASRRRKGGGAPADAAKSSRPRTRTAKASA